MSGQDGMPQQSQLAINKAVLKWSMSWLGWHDHSIMQDYYQRLEKWRNTSDAEVPEPRMPMYLTRKEIVKQVITPGEAVHVG